MSSCFLLNFANSKTNKQIVPIQNKANSVANSFDGIPVCSLSTTGTGSSTAMAPRQHDRNIREKVIFCTGHRLHVAAQRGVSSCAPQVCCKARFFVAVGHVYLLHHSDTVRYCTVYRVSGVSAVTNEKSTSHSTDGSYAAAYM